MYRTTPYLRRSSPHPRYFPPPLCHTSPRFELDFPRSFGWPFYQSLSALQTLRLIQLLCALVSAYQLTFHAPPLLGFAELECTDDPHRIRDRSFRTCYKTSPRPAFLFSRFTCYFSLRLQLQLSLSSTFIHYSPCALSLSFPSSPSPSASSPLQPPLPKSLTLSLTLAAAAAALFLVPPLFLVLFPLYLIPLAMARGLWNRSSVTLFPPLTPSSTKSVSFSLPLVSPVPHRVCSANLGTVGCTVGTLDPICRDDLERCRWCLGRHRPR